MKPALEQQQATQSDFDFILWHVLYVCVPCAHTYLWVSSYSIHILYIICTYDFIPYMYVWKFIKQLIVQSSCTHAYDVFLALPCLYFQFHQIALEN